MHYDITVIGGGIVGLATARQLQGRYRDKKILLIEKEDGLGKHQTGHNSGVIHAGVYYQPGSLKAKFCKQGLVETINFCRENRIPFEQCGKLLVATSHLEQERMQSLYRRCRQNEITCDLLDRQQLNDLEPDISGVGAIYVRDTGIVNFQEICRCLGDQFRQSGGEIRLNTEILAIRENDNGVCLTTGDKSITSTYLVCCAGLYADRLAKRSGLAINFQIIPFRGEYYRLPEDKSDLVRHLIYPVPDPALPFLGVHLTRMIDGNITVGPNAVLGWKREGYGRVNLSVTDTCEMLAFKGFWKLTATHFKHAMIEFRNSLDKRGYLKLVQRYCPQLSLADLLPHPAGIRAQAVLADGTLVHDFLFVESPRSLHVCNAPSPAATSAIPIGNYIAGKIATKIN